MLHFAEAYSQAVTQQSHGHQENAAPSKSVSIFDQNECLHRVDSERMYHVLRNPMDTTIVHVTTL